MGRINLFSYARKFSSHQSHYQENVNYNNQLIFCFKTIQYNLNQSERSLKPIKWKETGRSNMVNSTGCRAFNYNSQSHKRRKKATDTSLTEPEKRDQISPRKLSGTPFKTNSCVLGVRYIQMPLRNERGVTTESFPLR